MYRTDLRVVFAILCNVKDCYDLFPIDFIKILVAVAWERIWENWKNSFPQNPNLRHEETCHLFWNHQLDENDFYEHTAIAIIVFFNFKVYKDVKERSQRSFERKSVKIVSSNNLTKVNSVFFSFKESFVDCEVWI